MRRFQYKVSGIGLGFLFMHSVIQKCRLNCNGVCSLEGCGHRPRASRDLSAFVMFYE